MFRQITCALVVSAALGLFFQSTASEFEVLAQADPGTLGQVRGSVKDALDRLSWHEPVVSEARADRRIQRPTRPELRCADTDPGPITNLVHPVEEVDDAEADPEFAQPLRLKLPRDPHVDLHVGRQVIGIGRARRGRAAHAAAE